MKEREKGRKEEAIKKTVKKRRGKWLKEKRREREWTNEGAGEGEKRG